MNKTLETAARKEIKDGLEKLEEKHFHMFKRMYCHTKMDATIDEAVSLVPVDKLDNALCQVERTLEKLGK